MAAIRRQNVIICAPGETYTFTGPEEICSMVLGTASSAAGNIKAADGSNLWIANCNVTFVRISEEHEINVEAGCTINNTGAAGSLYVYIE